MFRGEYLIHTTHQHNYYYDVSITGRDVTVPFPIHFLERELQLMLGIYDSVIVRQLAPMGLDSAFLGQLLKIIPFNSSSLLLWYCRRNIVKTRSIYASVRVILILIRNLIQVM
jgi:hypothetical protein